MFLKDTPEVIKTVMECRNIINENLSDQTAIDIAIEHNILPSLQPIISGIRCLTEYMSAYVDKIVQPLHPKIHSYIQDTTQFLNCMSKIKSVPLNALIVSMDFKTLYTCIPHSDGIKAYEISMIENGFPYTEISSITKILDFISTHNYIEFNVTSNVLTHGTAMGGKIALTYASIFTWNCEKYLLNYCTDKHFLYLR